MSKKQTPKLTQHGIKLAVHIITFDFGNLVAKVCECLLRRGTLTKANISRYTDLPSEKVRQCLWVLIQHNCVQAFALEQEGGGGASTVVVTHYMALFSNIIHRMRFGKFMGSVSKEKDEESLQLLQGFLQHGRLTLTQSLDRASTGLSEGSSASQDTFRESFINLVSSRLVERCPSAEPLIPLPSQDEPPAKRSRQAAKFAMREVTLEERALAAAIPMDSERFSIADPVADSDEDNIGNNSSSVKGGKKRKHASVQWDSELDSSGGKKEPLWRVNFDEFINRLRIKACVEYARTEYDNAAALIVRSMLEGTKCSESTVCMSLESVFEEVIKTEEGRKMTLEHVRSSLEELRFCSEADGMYTIDLTDIIKSAQLEEVESIVLKKYDPGTFRIFRTLSSGRQLDTDKISDETFVDKKETPVNLFKLWKDNYVQMEKISMGGPRQADIFLWRVKKDNLWEQILDDLYHAALNLIIRNNYEVERDREIISRTKQQMDVEAKHLKQVRNLLAASLMKLDDAIMLFYDFL